MASGVYNLGDIGSPFHNREPEAGDAVISSLNIYCNYQSAVTKCYYPSASPSWLWGPGMSKPKQVHTIFCGIVAGPCAHL